MSQKSANDLNFYNLKIAEPIIATFSAQYPDKSGLSKLTYLLCNFLG